MPDPPLVTAIMFMGSRLQPIDAEGLFICIRHGANTWEVVPEPDIETDARAFYSALSAAAPR